MQVVVILGRYLQTCPRYTILPWKIYYFSLQRININSKDGHAGGYWEAWGANGACRVSLSSVPWGPSHIVPDLISPKTPIRPHSSKVTWYTERLGGHGWKYNKILLIIAARSFWYTAELRTQRNCQSRTCVKHIHMHTTTLDFDTIFPKEEKKNCDQE